MKHLREALSRDPDHAIASRTLKRLRRLTVDMERLRCLQSPANRSPSHDLPRPCVPFADLR